MLHNENLTYITSPNKIYPIYSLKLELFFLVLKDQERA